MDNSLVLSHLPWSFAYNHELEFLKRRSGAPEPAELADLFQKRGVEARLAWETIHTARRMSEATANRLGRDISAASFWSEQYPRALREIPSPPWNIFYLGELPAPEPTLAVVGSRKPDSYGSRLVAEFLTRLATRPLQLVSGLAYGIDSLAHLRSCDAGIRNFAVMGSGADVIYPSAHCALAERILAGGGGILSELPPGTPPAPMHFPRRNRIISGLADVVWVVQGAALSGSYHTARHALNQGKTVAACPCDIFSDLSQIPNRLIFEGAQILLRPQDLDSLLERPIHDQRQQMPFDKDHGSAK